MIRVRDEGGGRAARVGAYFDIPWFGWSAWETMYDFPHAARSSSTCRSRWSGALAESRKTVAHNNAEASAGDAAARRGLRAASGGGVPGKPPAPARRRRVARGGAAGRRRGRGDCVGRVEQTPDAELTARRARDPRRRYRAIRDAVAREPAVARQVGGAEARRSAARSCLSAPPPPAPRPAADEPARAMPRRGHPRRHVPRAAHRPGVALRPAVGDGADHDRPRPARHRDRHVAPAVESARRHVAAAAAAYAALNAVVLFDYGDWVVGLAGPLVVGGGRVGHAHRSSASSSSAASATASPGSSAATSTRSSSSTSSGTRSSRASRGRSAR